MDTLEKPTCWTCGREATHWYRGYIWTQDRYTEVRYACEGHAQPHIADTFARGRHWGRIGEDDGPSAY